MSAMDVDDPLPAPPTPTVLNSHYENRSSYRPQTYEESKAFVKRVTPSELIISPGFVPNFGSFPSLSPTDVVKPWLDNTTTPAKIYASANLEKLLLEELKQYHDSPTNTGFTPALQQVCNVATLPGLVGGSLAMPDVHSGYGFSIGNVAAFDATPGGNGVVSPGGVGFDINCGVRLLRTNLFEKDLGGVLGKEKLAQTLFDHVPVGVGSRGVIPTTMGELTEALEMGMDWSCREGYSWAEDKDHCEESGRLLGADNNEVGRRAKKRGLPQTGTLGAGNHYLEVQIVDEIFDQGSADRMGIGQIGQVVVMIHSGSRGLGHQVATDSLVKMESAMAKSGIILNDRQLACAPIESEEGQSYIKGMNAAANFAFVNRSSLTFLARQGE